MKTPLALSKDDDSVCMDHFFLDSNDAEHYIGGVRRRWTVDCPFHGFIHSVVFSQWAKTDFTDSFAAGACMGTCNACPVGTGECPSDCKWMDFEEDGSCWHCGFGCGELGCVRTNDCNLCHDTCTTGECTGYTDADCIEDP
jgi:hypothetical protein